MAAGGVLETVEKLQARLTGGGESKKLFKSLKRLAELPITIDILAETGVGKTVNGLRKHELVGEFAKSLVARWKKLVPQEPERNNVHSEERELDRSSSRKPQREPSPQEEEDEAENEYRAAIDPPRTKSVDHVSRDRKQSNRQQEERWVPSPPAQYSDQEDWDNDESHLEEPPDSPPLIYIDQREPQLTGSHHKASKGQSHLEAQYGHRETVDGAVMRRSKEHKTSHREKHRIEAKEEVNWSHERLPKPSGKDLHREQSSLSGTREKLENVERRARGHEHVTASSISRKDRPQLHSDNSHDPAPSVIKKERLQHPEEKPDLLKKQKSRELEKSKGERTRLDLDGPRAEREKPHTEREGKSKSHSKDTNQHEKKTVKFSSDVDSDTEDKFEQPTMSFESCLSYDLPKKKKKLVKKPVPPPPPAPPAPHKGSSSKQNGTKGSSHTSESSKRSLHEKRERTPSPPPKPKKIKIDVVPTLPDIPLPPIQPNYRPLPTLETVPFSPQKKKVVPTSVIEEEEAGFTGRRLNSKMQVYSGSKTTYLPKMMSLYEQCIRVLANNIDLIDEVGGVPFTLLEPVLEKCTPAQLYRIEECNHVLIEDTDRLWMGHCKRDFKKDEPDEFESWRELYLRLHDAREQKLAMLTQNIRSAHANKPQGRQAKMAFVNVEAKPPRDVRRRQEKFGTGGAVAKDKIRIIPAPFSPVRSSVTAPEESYDEPRSYDGPSTSSAYSSTSASSVSPPMGDLRRPPVKKIAPMMAKTIKAFKNRFSRR
ncbi:elongin-A [Ambystoma mexicanum]|uniref:elongin-A n=1 Tax=Ambystoma mexicanum TaxID=8296 RepID=UPI0037E93C74